MRIGVDYFRLDLIELLRQMNAQLFRSFTFEGDTAHFEVRFEGNSHVTVTITPEEGVELPDQIEMCRLIAWGTGRNVGANFDKSGKVVLTGYDPAVTDKFEIFWI